MSYYKTKQKVNLEIERLVKAGGKIGYSFILLIYQLSLEYEIGEATIKKRVELLKDIGMIKEEAGGVLVWTNKRGRD